MNKKIYGAIDLLGMYKGNIGVRKQTIVSV